MSAIIDENSRLLMIDNEAVIQPEMREDLDKVIAATCDKHTVSGGNYNLLKPSTVSYQSRLQDDIEGITGSNIGNAVSDWITTTPGKYYAISILLDGQRVSDGTSAYFIQRVNARKTDGTIVVYNRYPSSITTGYSYGKAYRAEEDVVAMRFQIQIAKDVILDIGDIAKLKSYKPMIVEGNTALNAVQNAINFEYVDGDEELPAIVEYTLKHDYTKVDKISSPYHRNVDYSMIPIAYYKGVGEDYSATFGRDTTYATFLAAFDTLITGHSGYVTKTVLGQSSDNQNICLYHFNPVRISERRTKIPKVIIVAGHHGWEKADIYGLYYLVDNLLNRWNLSPALEYLRNHVELLIVPVVNTYGFDNFLYKNANGVNINRNYDANWVLNPDPTSQQYGGAAPFDQPESQIIRDLVLDNLDAALVIDFHTCSTASATSFDVMTYYGVCPSGDAYYNRMIDVVAHQLTAISANFNEDYNLNSPDVLCGHINISNGNGIFRAWATDQNCVGVLVEGFTGFPNETPWTGNVYKGNEEMIVNYIITSLNYLK